MQFEQTAGSRVKWREPCVDAGGPLGGCCSHQGNDHRDHGGRRSIEREESKIKRLVLAWRGMSERALEDGPRPACLPVLHSLRRWLAEEAALGEDSVTSTCTCWIEGPCGSGDQRSCMCKHTHTK